MILLGLLRKGEHRQRATKISEIAERRIAAHRTKTGGADLRRDVSLGAALMARRVVRPLYELTAAASVVARGGVVGFQMPTLRPIVLPIGRGDVLIFATDGIRADFDAAPALECDTQSTADRILRQSGKTSDDALVLVARYLGLS